jgi:hypothetical protein
MPTEAGPVPSKPRGLNDLAICPTVQLMTSSLSNIISFLHYSKKALVNTEQKKPMQKCNKTYKKCCLNATQEK